MKTSSAGMKKKPVIKFSNDQNSPMVSKDLGCLTIVFLLIGLQMNDGRTVFALQPEVKID